MARRVRLVKKVNVASKGGKSRRKNSISIDFNGFAEYAELLDSLGADLKEIFTDAMEQAAETVQYDTEAAIAKGNLPARGLYSRGTTEASLIRDARVSWSGYTGEINVGFDTTVPGNGGFLITGTPYMAPDYKLEEIYRNKKYERDLMNDINEHFSDMLDSYLGG